MILKPTDRAEWLRLRQATGIGGSDAGTVLGLNPWCSNLQLWRYKTGIDIPEDISDNPSVKFGKEAEAPIRMLFKQDYPAWNVDYHEFWMYCNDKYPWLFATLDGEITDEKGRHGILEIKTTTIQNRNQWAEWENSIPQRYFAQVCHQLAATGWDFAIVRAYIRHYKNGDFRASVRDYRIERADVLDDIAYLIEKESEFMECAESNKPPAAIITI